MKKIKLFVSLALIVGGLKSGRAAATSDCVQFPKQVEAPVVKACEEDSHYSFLIAGTETRYAKDLYRARLVDTLRDWFTLQGMAMPIDGEIEFWLAVPESNPAAAQARAAMYWAGGAVVAFLPIAPEGWRLTDRQIAVLSEDFRYPSSYGHRPGSLLVHSQDDANHGDVVEFLAGHGLEEPRPVGKNRHVYQVDTFAELGALRAIEAHPRAKQLIKSVSLNSVVEWVALRQRVFAFSLPTQ
ncbi:MAG: hypothetical protein RL011_2104 [Pseudomonadota bacterium]|jgi:hypothetical protein